MSVINAIAQLFGDDGYQISRSVRLRSSASAYLNRTPASAGTRTTWTWSSWVKRGTLGGTQSVFGSSTGGSSPNFEFRFNSDAIDVYDNSGSIQWRLTTTQVFRDPSAWYHIVLAFDSTNATSSNRARLYVNGVQVTAFSTATYPSSSYASYWNSTLAATIGLSVGDQFDGYLTEINFIDGQALTPSSFGQNDPITGVWTPKKYAGTYGTNGFYLPFSDNSSTTNIALDKSGNNNNWTANNISLTAGTTYDSMIDTPTPYADGGNGRGNYAILNPIIGAASGATYTITQGNLYAVLTSSSNVIEVPATMALPTSGKWYWEVNVVSVNTTYGYPLAIGISDQGGIGNSANFLTNCYYYLSKSGNSYTNGTPTAYGASFTAGDTIGVAFDAGAGTLTFYKNNTSQGTAFSGLTGGPYYPKFGSNDGSTFAVNFGQRPFAYTPPTGFKALNTQNLPDSTIKAGNKYFDVNLYTGNGANPQTIVNAAGFAPDLVWTKIRSAVGNNFLADTVRGAANILQSDSTAAEAVGTGGIQFLNSNGFGVNGNQNTNAATYVGWQWKKGAAQGFDIQTWTGNGSATQTINHSLGVAPKMFIGKRRDISQAWNIWHKSLPGDQYYLDFTTSATNNAGSNFTSGGWGSSSFTVGNAYTASGAPFVAYLFSEVAGFSKFGSYTGNGSTDGPFVYTGFRPRYLLAKASSGASNWFVWDSARSTYNAATDMLFPNSSSATDPSSYPFDFVSNGLKIRAAAGLGVNENGTTYIFAVFAENPFKYSNAR